MLHRERDQNELQQLCKDKEEREKAEAEAATAEEDRGCRRDFLSKSGDFIILSVNIQLSRYLTTTFDQYPLDPNSLS